MNLKHELETPIASLKTAFSLLSEGKISKERILSNAQLSLERMTQIVNTLTDTLPHYSEVITKLGLVPLPEEGGYYKETYRSKRFIQSDDLGKKTECTAIYYLITEDSFSALHAVDQDEIFHFYAGNTVEMFQIDEKGNGKLINIGNKIFEDETPQVIVPHGVWQGTKLKDPRNGSWALLGCTVAPGFEFQNFHIKSREGLILQFPDHKELITKYTN